MKMLTKELLKSLPKLRATESKGEEALVIIKFFQPWGPWTWYGTEYDPDLREFFGLVRGFELELGYFSLDELESVRGPGGLRIERDLYWKPKTLREVIAKENGRN